MKSKNVRKSATISSHDQGSFSLLEIFIHFRLIEVIKSLIPIQSKWREKVTPAQSVTDEEKVSDW